MGMSLESPSSVVLCAWLEMALDLDADLNAGTNVQVLASERRSKSTEGVNTHCYLAIRVIAPLQLPL